MGISIDIYHLDRLSSDMVKSDNSTLILYPSLIFNQFFYFAKSLIPKEFAHTLFNHLRIMSSLASSSASLRSCPAQRTSCEGVRGPHGGRALFVYNLILKSGILSC
jgi:hypothetical protein